MNSSHFFLLKFYETRKHNFLDALPRLHFLTYFYNPYRTSVLLKACSFKLLFFLLIYFAKNEYFIYDNEDWQKKDKKKNNKKIIS